MEPLAELKDVLYKKMQLKLSANRGLYQKPLKDISSSLIQKAERSGKGAPLATFLPQQDTPVVVMDQLTPGGIGSVELYLNFEVSLLPLANHFGSGIVLVALCKVNGNKIYFTQLPIELRSGESSLFSEQEFDIAVRRGSKIVSWIECRLDEEQNCRLSELINSSIALHEAVILDVEAFKCTFIQWLRSRKQDKSDEHLSPSEKLASGWIKEYSARAN